MVVELSVFMKNVCVRVKEKVKGVYDRNKEDIASTTHKCTCIFDHDALSQMPSKTTVAWMKEHGCGNLWLTPPSMDCIQIHCMQGR